MCVGVLKETPKGKNLTRDLRLANLPPRRKCWAGARLRSLRTSYPSSRISGKGGRRINGVSGGVLRGGEFVPVLSTADM